MPSVALHTLGCKLNQAETEALGEQFLALGYDVVNHDSADIHIVNTCTVTHIADRKARHLVRFLRKNNPSAMIVATGCYVERATSDLSMAGADMVVNNEDKDRLPDLLAGHPKMGQAQFVHNRDAVHARRARSFIKIQDGCSHFCSYCIVPFVRSREFCIDASAVIQEINHRIARGYREVVLTGTRIGIYRDGALDLRQLLQKILSETGIRRLHLSSLQPQEISAELLDLWSDSRLCQHFHIALQSGSQSVLQRMGRQYSLDDYSRTIKLVREFVPQASITTDVMVGFPGESDAEFEQSHDFCRQMQFAALHVFSYSQRPYTRAAEMTGQVGERIKKERSRSMLGLAKASANAFRQKFIGQSAEVLFESEESPQSGVFSGFSNHYIRVYTGSDVPLANSIWTVKLIRQYHDGLWGEIIA